MSAQPAKDVPSTVGRAEVTHRLAGISTLNLTSRRGDVLLLAPIGNEVPAPINKPQPRLRRIGRGGFMDVARSMSTVEADDHAWRCDCLTLNQLRPYSPRPDTIFSFWPCSCRRAQAELVKQQSRATHKQFSSR